MDQGSGGTAGPFSAAIFRWRAVGTPQDKPPELTFAELADGILRSWPGYTLSSLLAEDAHELLVIRALLVETLGSAEDPDGE